MGLFTSVGALVVTYFVSRVLLLVSKSNAQAKWRLGLVHIVTWLLISSFVAVYRWSPYGGYDVNGGLVYLIPALFWFAVDRFRLVATAA